MLIHPPVNRHGHGHINCFIRKSAARNVLPHTSWYACAPRTHWYVHLSLGSTLRRGLLGANACESWDLSKNHKLLFKMTTLPQRSSRNTTDPYSLQNTEMSILPVKWIQKGISLSDFSFRMFIHPMCLLFSERPACAFVHICWARFLY